jgi:quercetin dioxygenase-like cupin family protein
MVNEKSMEWEDTALKGVKQKVLGIVRATGEFARLVKIEEGVKVPRHTHSTYQHTYGISGEMEVEGRKMGPGMYMFIPAGFPHGEFVAAKESVVFEVFGAPYSVELAE